MQGYIYALLAAICNSSIGVISGFGFKKLSFYQIAFFKCFFGFLIISLLALLNKNIRGQVASLLQKRTEIALLSFFGIFLLYYFETKAFSIAPVGIVAFLVYSTGILTIILGYFLLKEKITCILLVMSGAALIFNNFTAASLEGIIYALIGGVGYSIFLVLCRKFQITANIGFLWWLMGFGSLYLLIPSILTIDSISLPNSGFEYLLALAIIPTLGGFYFTAKSLNLIEASKVQVIEMSDPLFATLLAFIFLGEIIDTDLFVVLLHLTVKLINLAQYYQTLNNYKMMIKLPLYLNWIMLVPSIVTFLMILVNRKAVPALLSGIIVSIIIQYIISENNIFTISKAHIYSIFYSGNSIYWNNIFILLFLWFLGILISTLNNSGAISVVADILERHVKTQLQAKLYSASGSILGLFISAIFFMVITGYIYSKHIDPNIFEILSNIQIGASLFLSTIMSLLIALFFYRDNIKLLKYSISEGFKTMAPAMQILLLAWVFSFSLSELNVGTYISSLMHSKYITTTNIPIITFLVAGAMSLATGTSWVTFSILIPIVCQLCLTHNSELIPFSIGAVLAGAVFGDHCSPISDTSILSSTGAGCNHMEHITTQLPYCILAALMALLGYIIF